MTTGDREVLSASMTIDPAAAIARVDRRLFGSFVEHMGRAVYDGLYEPGHPTADGHGFRRDVIDLVRELGVTTVRYPGGNFVSGYRWEDGVGPRESRPRRLDLAWHSTETNQIGLHEFAEWAALAGCELMLAVNLGTRGIQEAVDLLEYAAVPSGTALSDRRRANGRSDPFGVRMWCLGNEMDGEWQLGRMGPDDYGKLAARTAAAMRRLDPTLELVACGSSHRGMPTFGEWERVVLGHAYDEVDFISCHAYYRHGDDDLAGFLASGVDMDRFIESVVATVDHVKAVRRSSSTVDISFDEWNVWDESRYRREDQIEGVDRWPVAPRLLEDVYTAADAVVVGGLLISLLRHAGRVRSASLAQLVNVIAPIMTEPGGPAWRQTIFHPFALTAAAGHGTAVDVRLESPEHDTHRYGRVPVLDAVAVLDDAGATSLFVVNRSTEHPVSLTASVRALGGTTVTDSVTVHDADPYATNTSGDPDRVRPRPNRSAELVGDELRLRVPPVSWTRVQLGVPAGVRTVQV